MPFSSVVFYDISYKMKCLYGKITIFAAKIYQSIIQ